MKYQTFTFSAFASAFLFACSPTPVEQASPADPSKLPEFKAHTECLRQGIMQMSETKGNSVDLGFMVAQRCKPERVAFLMAITTSDMIAWRLEPEAERSDIASVAEGIVRRRGY